MWAVIRFGVARGVFSNEAGLGSAPIAHAAAKTKDPVRQGMIAMLGTFIDTIIICTITGLVIITSGLWTSGESGAALTSMAFAKAMPGVGNYIVTFSLAIFALPVGVTMNLNFIWLVADTLNAMMAIPNLVTLVLLSSVVFKLVRDYLAKEFAEKEGKTIAE